MKKYISYLLTLALLVPTLVSCTEQLEEIRAKKNTHTVYFSTSSQTTKTGLTIDGNMVNPDWRQTDVENVHFFEMETAGGDAAYAVATKINPSSDNITAQFEASFGEEMDIIVNPSDPPAGTKAGDGSGTGYYYGAVVAQKNSDNEDDYTFKIPAEQKPDDRTLKDPDADFLVGYSRKAYAAYNDEENDVDLYFDRVAALGRFAFTKFKGTDEKVMSVKIESEAGLVGYASYSNITWGDENAVSFTRVEGPLTLSYGENGVAVPTGADAFYAYFVVIPGKATITSIEVVTDQYRYTKTPAEPVPFTFSAKEFMPIAMDLSKATAEKISSNVWYKASVLEAGYDYLIVSGGQALKNNEGATAAVAVTPEDDIISFESATDPTIIWRATAHTENTGDNGQGGIIAGHFTLTNDGMYLLRDSQEITLGNAIPSAKPKYAVWDYDGTYLKQESSDTQTQYCYYNNGWATGYTQNGAVPASSIKTVEIFTTRPPQSINFEKSDYDWILEDGDFTAPELLGDPVGAVSYASSDVSIAEVNAETGAVTIKKAGNVVISVTAAGSTEYQTTVASYTIHITSNNIPTWYKADEIVNGETYIVVNNGSALKNNGGSLAAETKDMFSGTSFQYEEDITLMWKATGNSASFTLKNDDKYLRRSGTSGLQISSTNSSNNCTYDGQYVKIATSYVLYCNNGTWTTGSNTTTGREVTFYTRTPQLASRNLSFSAETVTHNLANGVDVNEPKLTGASDAALVGVSYAKTSDPKGVISTIDATTGAITLTSGKTGTAVITASAAANETYKAESVSYALIVKEGSAPLKYVKISSTSDLTVGAQYLLVYEGGGTGDNAAPKVFRPTLASDGKTFNKAVGDALDVEITSGTIISDDYVFGHLTLESGYYLKVDKFGNYLYPGSVTSGNNTTYYLSAESTATNAVNISFSNEGIAQVAISSKYLVWSTSSHYFSCNSTVSGSYSTGICLYKLDDSATPPTPEKQERNLSFGTESFSCTLGQSATFPPLSGKTEGVTYSSSNESVATVNASGVVTAKAAGTTIIKAEAQESDTYLAGSAQYTLTVNAAPGTEKYYVLVTSEPASWNGKYLIVNTATDGTGSAMNGTGTANVTISGGKILSTSTVDGYALTVTSAGEVHPNQTESSQGLIAYDITFSDGDWLYWYSSKYKQTTEDQSSRHNKCTLFYDNGVRLMSAGYNVNLSGQTISDPSKNYLHYSSSNSKYTMGSSYANDRVQLYKLDEGGTTPGGGDDSEPPTPTSTSYSRVSFAAGITTGKYLIVNPADAQVFTTVTSYPNSASVTPSNGVISGDYASYEVTITKSGNNYTIQNASGQYLYYVYTSGDTQTRVAYKSDTENWAVSSVSSDANGFDLNCAGGSGTQHIYWNNSSAGTFFKIGSQSTGVHLYKKADNP